MAVGDDYHQVFLDADNLNDLRTLMQCVRDADVFILMLTDGVSLSVLYLSPALIGEGFEGLLDSSL